MLGTLTYRLVRKCIAAYGHMAEKELCKQFKFFGTDSHVHYPFRISHCEMIRIGNNVTILSDARMQVYPELTGMHSMITVGDGCFIGYRNSFLAGGNIILGKHVLMASDILISSENHGVDPESEVPYMDQPLICKDVTIGDGTWIGQSVQIMPGVRIGKKCIIGAGSVVTKSIPDYSIAGGNPARVIKRFNFEHSRWERVEG